MLLVVFGFHSLFLKGLEMAIFLLVGFPLFSNYYETMTNDFGAEAHNMSSVVVLFCYSCLKAMNNVVDTK